MSSSDDRWERLIQGLRAGHAEIVADFCREYGPMLQGLADKKLARGIRRRVEPEDVVQSACRTFLRRVQGGEFELGVAESLWRLLCAITLSKVREQTRFHLCQKRGVNREAPAGFSTESGTNIAFAPVDPGLSPAEAAEFADQFEKILDSLDEEERQAVDLKLQQLTNEEVSRRMGCSERTVRRLLKRLESRLVRAFEA
jgi:RNA polymerase sigma factor (sigma-70 family)